jgi:Flp pilus assembly protein TadG
MKSQRFRRERGATLVEFAIACTVFFLLVFGAISFSQAILQYNIVSSASKAAVRWAAVRGSTSGQTAATESDVHDFIVTKMGGISEIDSTTWNPTTKAVGSVVTVVVRASFTTGVPRLPSFTIPMRSAAQMEILR